MLTAKSSMSIYFFDQDHAHSYEFVTYKENADKNFHLEICIFWHCSWTDFYNEDEEPRKVYWNFDF